MRKTQHQYSVIVPTQNTIANIKRSAISYRGQEVLLCFLTDPYNALDQKLQLTREALQIFKANDVIPVILTKAGLKSMRDFDLLDGSSKYGATLTFINKVDSLQWESGAALPDERMQALREAKARGIYTWVSLEPVIDPEQTLEIIHKTHEYIDHYKVGKWNYDKRSNEINWKKFHADVVEILQRYQKEYYIKESLRRA
jgi:DNA repair photolyase